VFVAAWQRATGQDAGSQYVDPQFVDINTSPAGLKLENGSSAVGKASGTPSYVDDDSVSGSPKLAADARPTPPNVKPDRESLSAQLAVTRHRTTA
jgi:hypothetical protein